MPSSCRPLLNLKSYPLKQAKGRDPDRYMAGIREIVLMGLLGMHMEGRKLTASGLAGLSLFDLVHKYQKFTSIKNADNTLVVINLYS